MNTIITHKLTNGLLLLFSALLLSGCADNNNNNNGDSLTVTSYNMGLALNFVPYTPERLPVNEQLVMEYESDVICFQEVWLDDQVEAITNAVSENLPFIYSVPPEQIFSEACTSAEVADLETCANTFCSGLSGPNLVSCVTNNQQCVDALGDLPPTCQTAVFAGVGLPNITVDALVDLVTQPSVGVFAFDGSLGLILASRYKLSNLEFQDFIDNSSSNHRGALYAEINVNEQTHVIGCTHPTANLSVPYPTAGNFGSWGEENRFMQEQMITFVNNKAGNNPIYFAGDFNCSIANASNQVDADFADNCQLWLDDGFTDPAADQLGCTFCSDENLILIGEKVPGGAGGEGNTLLDHVFIKNVENSNEITAERVFDDPVEIQSLDPVQELSLEDSPLTTHPSDHFGVKVAIPL
jgi:endonuclease/exonuclease/phosphatase family metal-dependent hydrolase